MKTIADRVDSGDFLVIGGGVAGCVAALKAVTSGLKVILWEKAGILRSGSASVGVRNLRNFRPPELGLKDIAENICNQGTFLGGPERLFRGIVDENITYMGFKTCWDTVNDLKRWGIDLSWQGEEYNLRKDPRFNARTTLRFRGGAEFKKKLARKVMDSPITLLERVKAVDVLTHKNRIAGATGLNVRSGEFVAARVKAVLISTGSVMRLYHPREGFPAGRFTMIYTHAPSPGDGIAMAFRAGAQLTNMEMTSEGGGGAVISPHPYDRLCTRTGPFLGPDTRAPIVNARGEKIGAGKVDVELIFKEEKEGRGPCFIDATTLDENVHQSIQHAKKDVQPISAHFSKERGFNSRTHKYELLPYKGDRIAYPLAGIKIDEQTRTSVKGLYAAGDTVGGTTYDGVAGALVFGRKAGMEATKYARRVKAHPLNAEHLASSKEAVFAPMLVKDGIDPIELELKIRDITERYCGAYRSEGRIAQGLWRLNSVKERFFSQLQARTPHGLMNVLSAKNLLLLAEVHLNCARERKESKPGNWRIDFPDKKDAPWGKSVMAKKEGEKIKLFRKKMPALKPKYLNG